MRIHVAFTPAEAAEPPVGVVVDVLRATSAVAQALAARVDALDVVPRLTGVRAAAAEIAAA